MYPLTPPPLQAVPPAVRGIAAMAAVLASIGAVGSIEAMAMHYALHTAAPEPIVARVADPARCGAPATPPASGQAS